MALKIVPKSGSPPLSVVVLPLSGSLNISDDGSVSDILTRPTDNIHPSIFLPLKKGFFGQVMLIIQPRQRSTGLQ